MGAATVAAVVVIAALTSEQDDWQPVGLLLVLAAATLAADAATVSARRIRISAGLMVLTTIMALLGPAPAVAVALLSTVVETRVNRIAWTAAVHNLAIFSLLGLLGGVTFSVLGDAFGLDRSDAAYALLVPPVYALLTALNFILVVAFHPYLADADRWQTLRESLLPTLPFELINAILAAVTVLAWTEAGLAAAAAVLIVLVGTVPLARMLSSALRSGDDLVALRVVSDARADEVARLSSDRERLLSEVLDAESRERARLAESLHDGPMQRLTALRQDTAEEGRDTARLDEAIAETRALLSAFHPATVRELGFEASLRAAVAPFPTAQAVTLTIRSELNDRALADTPLLPIAQELVVNAVKHAAPTAIDVAVARRDGRLILEVNDDGVGIDALPSGRAVQAGHLGLAMVRRRVEDAGGAFEIETRADGGTRSRVTLPSTRRAPG
jgi:two-component system NarL family sensor kinase